MKTKDITTDPLCTTYMILHIQTKASKNYKEKNSKTIHVCSESDAVLYSICSYQNSWCNSMSSAVIAIPIQTRFLSAAFKLKLSVNCFH